MRAFAPLVLAILAAVPGACAPAPVPKGIARMAFRRPEPSPPGDAAAAARADLGRSLFFDTRMSGNGSRACATCHQPDLGWGDGLALAQTLSGGSLPTRTPTVLNLAAVDGPMGWDGKFAGIDQVAFGPIANPENMGSSESGALASVRADPAYGQAFALAFGDATVTRTRVEAALGTFIRGLVSAPDRFDLWVEGDEEALTASERRGFDLFRGNADCAACHTGWAMTDGAFHDVGVGGPQPGRGRFFPGSRKLQHAWKTPGLREIAKRGPYMHDGSLPTLEAVVDHYDKGGLAHRPSLAREVRPLGLTPRERADLVAFLKALDTKSTKDGSRQRAADAKE